MRAQLHDSADNVAREEGHQFDGVRLLSEEIVGEAFSNQIGDLFMDEHIPTASHTHSADFATGPG